MQNANRGRVTQCLVNDAIALGQTKQCGELLLAGVSIHIEMQSNLLEADRHIFGNAECTTKIKVTLRANCCAA